MLPVVFLFLKNPVKKESEEALSLTYFDIKLFQNFYFPIEVVANFLST